MTILTRLWLDKMGCIVNPNMWIGDGWFYCAVCKEYSRHYAMSHTELPGKCFEVCKKCNSYSGAN